MYTWLREVWLTYKIYFHHRIKSNYVYRIYNPWMCNVQQDIAVQVREQQIHCMQIAEQFHF